MAYLEFMDVDKVCDTAHEVGDEALWTQGDASASTKKFLDTK